MHLSPSQPKEGTIYYIAKSFRNERVENPGSDDPLDQVELTP